MFAVAGVDGRTWYMTQDKGLQRRLVQKGFKPRPRVHTILFHLDLFSQQPVLHFTRIVWTGLQSVLSKATSGVDSSLDGP